MSKLYQHIQIIVWVSVTLLWLIVAILLLVSLISYTSSDPSWTHLGSHTDHISNLAGLSGAWVSDFLYTFFGLASWWLVIVACFESWQVWRTMTRPHGIIRLIGYVVLLLLTAICFGLIGLLNNNLALGGVAGQVVALALTQILPTIVAILLTSLLMALVLAYVFNIKQLFGFNRRRQKAIEADAQAIYEYLQISTNKNLESLTLTGLEMDIDSKQNISEPQDIASHSQPSPTFSGQNQSVLSSFLHETGFNDERNDEWEANYKSKNAFKPLSSNFVQNTKLTEKLDAKLQAEVIAEPKGFAVTSSKKATKKNEKKVEKKSEKSTMWQSHDTATFQPLQSSMVQSQAFEQKVSVNDYDADYDDEIEMDETSYHTDSNRTAIEQYDDQLATSMVVKDIDKTDNIENVANVNQHITVEKPTVVEIDNVGMLVDTQDDVFANLGNSIYQATKDFQAALHHQENETTVNQSMLMNHDEPSKESEIVYQHETVHQTTFNHHNSIQPESEFVEEDTIVDNYPVTNDMYDNCDNHNVSDLVTYTGYSTPKPTQVELYEQPQNPLDIHNDAVFANQSRAMQTAKHRASLTPIPELSLLDLPDVHRKPSYTPEQLQQLSELLEIKLQEFNVKASVVNAQMGPVVTRFEVELAPGVKASKVTGIARDLARSLSMASVRVVEVIPGKPYIGIEIPNINRQMVRLIELLQTPEFQDPEGLLSMAMGKDIAGRAVITDLAKAPHMLVAGTTGSGKSVLVNSLLLSLLLKYTPDNLRLILIDPKQLELANYNDIPHLLTPVVTDMTEATSSLAWCVAEMERRYQLMSLFKVRKLAEFNKKVLEAEQNGLPLLDPLWRITDSASQDKPPKLKSLPQIVIVADEFADMIMQIGKPAEELITRLAQKSRAAGIHLILATQRPSVDVITGLIKANIPVRSALRVNSKVDSRTILDAGGAEDMLGHGDMLFLGPGQNEPVRVHGAFISDAEVNRICDAWRERGSPDYVQNMFDNFDVSSSGQQQNDSGGGTFGDDDPLYDEVVAFVMETRKVSASSIQRKFSIGYNRAARIVDAMESAGLVSAMGKSGKRELLM